MQAIGDDEEVQPEDDKIDDGPVILASQGNQMGFDEKELDTECCICLFSKQEVVLPHCGHAFCEPCISDWWQKQASQKECPICCQKLEKDQTGDSFFELIDVDGKDDVAD